jgi:transglutaminase-like putative cysteine protease
MQAFLRATDVIDWRDPRVLACARELRGSASDPAVIAERCFAFVRDEVTHTADAGLDVVTCRASEVLAQRTGYCYAKSHLLAALLRANGIPAGFCYQRFAQGTDGRTFMLHGLNAVWLDGHGWYRIDARGNRADVDAQFTPPVERLAFAVEQPEAGEIDSREVWPDPLPQVVHALQSHTSAQDLNHALPDAPHLAHGRAAEPKVWSPKVSA